VARLGVGQDVHVALHLGRVLVELLYLNISKPRVRMLITDLDTGLMDVGDVVQLDRAAQVVVLDSESFDGNDIIRQRELEALARLADEALLDSDDLGLPVWVLRDGLLVERDLRVLLNIELVGAVRLITLPRPIEVAWPILIECQHLDNLVACLDLLAVELRDLVVLWAEQFANGEEGCLGDIVLPEVEWILL